MKGGKAIEEETSGFDEESAKGKDKWFLGGWEGGWKDGALTGNQEGSSRDIKKMFIFVIIEKITVKIIKIRVFFRKFSRKLAVKIIKNPYFFCHFWGFYRFFGGDQGAG